MPAKRNHPACDGCARGYMNALSRLRAKKRITFRAMARRVPYSATSLYNAQNGDKFPGRQLAGAFVQACGESPDIWIFHWDRVMRCEGAHRYDSHLPGPPHAT